MTETNKEKKNELISFIIDNEFVTAPKLQNKFIDLVEEVIKEAKHEVLNETKNEDVKETKQLNYDLTLLNQSWIEFANESDGIQTTMCYNDFIKAIEKISNNVNN